jgi:two-component system LytT family response regulator
MPPRIRTLIVDDMPPARDRIRRHLSPAADFEIVGECGDGASALDAIAAEKPDLVFLDVQMPGFDGIDVAARLDPADRPLILFITAYDEHALRAFELHALDYLVKPFEAERFARSLERVRAQFALRLAAGLDPAYRTRLDGLFGELLSPRYVDRLSVRDRGRTVLIEVAAIDWIEAQGNYAALRIAGGTHLVRESLNDLERRLDPTLFLRIHRGTIVRVDRIAAVSPLLGGDQRVTLLDGMVLRASRTYRAQLKEALNDDRLYAR